jgi:hypothetical protein
MLAAAYVNPGRPVIVYDYTPTPSAWTISSANPSSSGQTPSVGL